MLDEQVSESQSESGPRKRRRIQVKIRRDKGARIMKERDRVLLSWIAEQYAVRADTLRQLASRMPGHHSERFAPGPAGITESALLQILDRWKREPAWAGYKRYYEGAPGWVWVTPYMLEVLHAQGRIPRYGRHVLKESTLNHLHAINSVRLHYERRHPERRWVSERSLRKLLGRREEGDELAHVPDGQVWLNEKQAVAVEVEFSPKTPQQYDEILDELLISGVLLPDGSAFRYRSVWYFVSDATDDNVQARNLVEAARDRLPETYQARVMLIDLKDLMPHDDAAAAPPPGLGSEGGQEEN